MLADINETEARLISNPEGKQEIKITKLAGNDIVTDIRLSETFNPDGNYLDINISYCKYPDS